MVLILELLALAVLSGILGRMGGAGKSGQWYEKILDTKWRDLGCSLLVVVAFCLVFGFYASFWWVYALIFGLHWAAFSTYWDRLFGYDNMWFSGIMVGIALCPIIIMDTGLWWLVLARAAVLGVSWGLLNKFLPKKVFVWDRAVAEEFSRYFISL